MEPRSLLRPRARRFEIGDWIWVAAITLVAAVLRLWRLDQLPPGLFHDEAYNGLDVLRVLSGWLPIYFPGNYGREPLFIYLVAGSVAALGRSLGAIRVVSAILGTLTIPAAYLAARELFNRRIGLLTAAITAVTLWHVALSRVGFRAISLPLVAALAIWQGALAFRTNRPSHWVLAGALMGLCFYTYLSARFIPVVLLVLGIGYWVLRVARRSLKYPIPSTQYLITGSLVALIVLLPLGVYALAHADEMILRAGQVSVFNPEISGGKPWELLARQTLETTAMFFWRGDMNPRHNVPGRAVFDPVMATFFFVGLIACLRKRVSGWFVLIWTGVMLLPSSLTENAPSFLRAAGALPVAFIIPAAGLDAVWTWFDARWRKEIGAMVVGLALLTALTITAATYFGAYSTSRELHEAFDASPVEMAVEVNRWLGTGWQGRGLVASSGSLAPGRYAWIDRSLWDFSIAVPFLVTESPAPSARLRWMPVTSMPADATAIKIMALPTDENVLASLPRGWRIRARRGSEVGGVPGQEPYLLYVSFEAEPAHGVRVLAHFGDKIELVSQAVRVTAPGKLVLHTEWRVIADIGEDWTLFAHIVREGQVIAQSDGQPAGGLLPTSQWRVGDVIVDERELAGSFDVGRDELRVGLYRPDTNTRLVVWNADGNSTGLDYWRIVP